MTAIKNTAQHLKNTHNKTFLVISESLSCPHIPLRDFLPHAAPWWWTASTAPGPPRLRGPSGKVPKDHGSKSRAVWRGFGVVELYFHQCQYQSVDWKWLWAEAERQTEETDTLISVKLKCSKTFYTLWPNSLLSFRVRMKLQTSAKCKNWWQSSVCSYVSFKIWWNNDEKMRNWTFSSTIMWLYSNGRDKMTIHPRISLLSPITNAFVFAFNEWSCLFWPTCSPWCFIRCCCNRGRDGGPYLDLNRDCCGCVNPQQPLCV